ncbi:hypothetical protein ABVT39_007356 [Epinephelus coioides]
MTLRGLRARATLFLLTTLLSAIKGEPQLLGSSEPVVGLVGHHVILPCSVQPARSVTEKTVEWTRSDLKSKFVHVFRQGRELYDEQNPSFRQRTSLFLHEVKNGNVSLKLSDLKLSDEGNYTCKLVPSNLETSIQVVIGAVSEPKISAVEGTSNVLQCDALNWFPKPEMEWRDGKGNIIPHHDDNTEHNEYYSVSSKITVKMMVNNNFTCTVRQQSIRQSRQTSYTVPYVYTELFALKNSKDALIGFFIFSLMFILALILAIVLYMNGSTRQCVRRTIGIDEVDGSTREQEKCLQYENERLEKEVSRLAAELGRWQRENEHLEKEVSRLTAELGSRQQEN